MRHAPCEFQIKREVRAFERGFYFGDEALNDGLLVGQKIDECRPGVSSLKPYAAFIRLLVTATNFLHNRLRRCVGPYGE